MLLALRDAAFAKGRFALVAGVIALLTLLLSMLSGLTGGLAQQSTSALKQLGTHGVERILVRGDSLSLSAITAEELEAAPAGSVPLTIGMARIQKSADDSPTQVAVFAADRTAAPTAAGFVPSIPAEGIALPAATAADLGVKGGDTVLVNGTEAEVSSTTADDVQYSHAAVAYMPADAAAKALHSSAPNAVLTSDANASVAGLSSLTVKESFNAVPGFKSENGSLTMIQGILYVIAGLVVAAFLTIWTLQRTKDLALLRAIGASTAFLVKDGLGQSLIVLLGGVILGGLAGWGLGALASTAVPFEFSLKALGLPGVLVLGVGLLGSLAAVTRVRSISPLTALGGN